METLPRTRNNDTVVQILEKEILIYNLKTHKAYMLNETSKNIYQACDGETSIDELKDIYNFTDDIIYLALLEFDKHDLLESFPSSAFPFGAMTRRELARKVGLASVVALPAISLLVAPPASNAASTCVNPGGQAPNTTVRSGAFVGCFADCSAPTVTAKCCSNSASATGIVCDSGPPVRTTCLCN